LTGSQFINEHRPDIEERHSILVFAYSRFLFAKFSGDSQPLARVDLAGAETPGRADPDRRRN
jgi:hypothetical protein